MRTRARANQGGSIVSFIIVGTLLLAGLGGGVYYLSQRSDSSQLESQVAENDNEQEDVAKAPEEKNEEAETKDSSDKSDDKDRSGVLNTGGGSGDDKKPEEDKPAPRDESAPREPATRERGESTPPERIAGTGGQGSAQELPQTGPAETLISLVALGAITFVLVVFRRSRRELASELN